MARPPSVWSILQQLVKIDKTTPDTQPYHSVAAVLDTPVTAVAGMCACILRPKDASKAHTRTTRHHKNAWHWVGSDAMMAASSDRADATEQIAASSTAPGADNGADNGEGEPPTDADDAYRESDKRHANDTITTC